MPSPNEIADPDDLLRRGLGMIQSARPLLFRSNEEDICGLADVIEDGEEMIVDSYRALCCANESLKERLAALIGIASNMRAWGDQMADRLEHAGEAEEIAARAAIEGWTMARAALREFAKAEGGEKIDGR